MLNKILNIFLVLFLLFFSFNFLSASEIFGEISTNANYHDDGDDLLEEEDDSDSVVLNNSSGGALILNFNDQGGEQEEIKVLGISQYADGSLVRGSDQRIFVLYGEFKDYICSFAKLQRYAGQIIYSISDEYLEQYKTRNYVHGDLVREKGNVKVFVIEFGKLRHVLSLEELRANFKGEEIFNLSGEEIELYY